MKQWKWLHEEPLTKQTAVSEIVNIVLHNRGFADPVVRDLFLHPSLDQVTLANAGISPEAVEIAIRRIKQAIDQQEPITVYTDYDVDGVSAGTIIWETLHQAGAKVLPYIPHREQEGYGLSEYGIKRIHDEHHTRLLITVDHGITAAAKIKTARELGIETIILDHHVLPETLPQTIATVHTTQLCAGGIAWLFSRALRHSLGLITSEQQEREYLDLAAMATIADLVPLTGTNRILVAHGLAQLRTSSRLGLQALIEESGLQIGDIGVYEVGHMLAPRINAMGRLTHALDALRLMCTKDPLRAHNLARLLGETNKERQQLTESATMHAMERVSASWKESNRVILVADASYNQGVIGLVAGRLAQEFYRPAIVLAQGKEFSKASARSIPGWNLVEMIRKAQDLLVDVGGHPMAAGFTIRTDNIPLLTERLEEIAHQEMESSLLVPLLSLDAQLPMASLTGELIDTLSTLAPFGVGNPQPVFSSHNLRLIRANLVGRDKKHLKLLLREPGSTAEAVEAIGFGMGEIYPSLRADMPLDVAYTLDRNTWNGTSRIQMKLRDIHLPG